MNMPGKPSRPSQQSPSAEADAPRRDRARKGGSQEDMQPPPTGANRGSPAAPVMKQFQKTRDESSGRS